MIEAATVPGVLQLLLASVSLWGTWLLLAVAAVLCSRWLPFDRGRVLSRLPVHLAVVVIIAASGLLAARATALPAWASTAGLGRSGGTVAGRTGGAPVPARLAFGGLLYAVVATGYHAVAWSRRAREREHRAVLAEGRLAQAQLAALQMQLNPHFLFNTLNGISALIHADPAAADRMLGDLSELLRAALEASDEQQVALRQELVFLDRYLAIEQARFAGRFKVERAIEPAALDGLVPTLMLQPLVENAIKHGIEPVRKLGTIRVTATRRGNTMHLSVADTGSGMVEGQQSTRGHGIGLANVRARLEQLYPGTHVFTIQRTETFGCVIMIDFPFDVAPGPVATEVPA